MYHLIDTNTMTVLATNYNMQTLLDLRRYEYPKLDHYLVCDSDLAFRKDSEVRALAKRYLNKQDGSRESLILELRQYPFPTCDINGQELAQLVEGLRENDLKTRKYTKGMLIKVPVGVPQSHTGELQANPCILTQKIKLKPHENAIRSSPVKDTIYETADQMWENAGKPKDIKVVLELRKLIYARLAKEYGFKKDSVSNTLAGWWKLKVKSEI